MPGAMQSVGQRSQSDMARAGHRLEPHILRTLHRLSRTGGATPTYIFAVGILILMSMLIAGYFYMVWAKTRDGRMSSGRKGPD